MGFGMGDCLRFFKTRKDSDTKGPKTEILNV